jgi:uncharacterized SAM-binding protein YcdF (DUF218 family)
MPDYAIIFGAGVWPDGAPSLTLRHRIDGALAWARANPESTLMPTGGIGRYGPAEALVMRGCLVEAGIDPDRIVAETKGRDTLESVRLCDALLRARGDCRRLAVCTSPYHQRRCALLLRLLGYDVVIPPMPNAWGHLSRFQYARILLKELAATPYDAVLLKTRRRLPPTPPPSL